MFSYKLKKFHILWNYQTEEKATDGRYCYSRQAQAIIDKLQSEVDELRELYNQSRAQVAGLTD